jgi:hypothetical protein
VQTILNFLVLLLVSSNLYAQDEGKDLTALGLDLNQESDLAIHSMLYQIGLKDRTNKILGDKTCIEFSKDNDGNSVLSFGVNTDAFETGSAELSADNQAQYAKTKSSLNKLFSFFKSANYNPEVSIRSYADPQHNIMSKYKESGSYHSSVKDKVFGDDFKDLNHLNTDSKRRNYLLAHDRGSVFKDQFIPKDLQNSVSVKPFNSSRLEKGNTSQNSEKYACPTRRSIAVDMKFNPNFKIKSKPGSFSPAFSILRGDENRKNIVAAVFDASSKNESELSAVCDNSSSKDFIKVAKDRYNRLKSIMDKGVLLKNVENPNATVKSDNKKIARFKGNYKEAIANLMARELSPSSIQDKCERFDKFSYRLNKDYFSDCITRMKEIKETYSSYESNKSDENFFAFISNLFYTRGNDRRAIDQRMVINNICSYNKSNDKVADQQAGECTAFRDLVEVVKQSSDKVFASGKVKNSSHFMDCFSNKLYLNQELKKAPGRYLFPVSDMRDPATGNLNIDFSGENIPDTKKGKGYICQACGSGLSYNETTNKLDVKLRASFNDHTKEQKADSQSTYDHYHHPSSGADLDKIGTQKGLNLYIVKNCDVSNVDDLKKNAIPVNLQDLKSKKVKVSPTDCVYKSPVVSSCIHAPDGVGDGESSKLNYVSTLPSFLTGKNVEIALENQVVTMKSISDSLKQDYVNYCAISEEGQKALMGTPDEVIDDILCKNKDISIPSLDNNSQQDCPEVAAVIAN